MIGELTIKRLRQCVAAISERRWHDEDRQFQLVAWQTRYICQFLACTVPSSEAGSHPLLDRANEIGREWEDEETQSKDPEPGSYESFMMFAGMAGGKPNK